MRAQNQWGGGGLVFSLVTFGNSETCVFKTCGASFVIQEMYFQNKWETAFEFNNY